MTRKNFLRSFSLAGITFGLPLQLTGGVTGLPGKKIMANPVIEKVATAMLAMQRATWEQGVAMQAFLESGEKETLIVMAKDAVLRQSKDGRLAMLGEEYALTDAAAPGESVLWAAKETGNPVLYGGFKRLLDYVLNKAPRNDEGVIYHFTNLPQIWSDSIYMLPPFLAAAGNYNEAFKQIEGVRNCLWNKDKKLFSHIWDSDKRQLISKDFWGVGNGWAAAGISRVIKSMPVTMQIERDKLIGFVKEVINGCLSYMREDGFFYNIVDDPGSFVETNLSQMISYSIYIGIKGGWLSRSYKQKADLMRSAAYSKIDELGLVQGVCGSPDFDHPGTAVEGQAFFILMETAYNDLG